ncbi:MAG: hypothetical protein O3A25_00685 [Acidobacteria bacterium]|nr:hypothetical protein [Acidobacteriota bacterium]
MTTHRTACRCAAGWALLFVTAGSLATPPEIHAQQSFATGQNISPAYDGWEKNVDGSFNLVFGYMNRNWEEVIDVPIGPDNAIEPGGPDWQQPTRFHPRRNRFSFRVRVPADFGDKELVWTLTTNGRTELAYATLKPDYFIDNMVIQANNGAAGAAGGTPELADNKAPALTVDGDHSRTVRAGEPLSLTAVATDDGVPRKRRLAPTNPRRPGRITTDTATGLRVSWLVYRGPGGVTFNPPQISTWEDTRVGRDSPWSPGWSTPDPPEEGRWVTEAVFDKPGTYLLQVLAHDGGLSTSDSVTVTVTP